MSRQEDREQENRRTEKERIEAEQVCMVQSEFLVLSAYETFHDSCSGLLAPCHV